MLLSEFLAKQPDLKRMTVSGDLGRGYISKIGRPKHAYTVRQPLEVLCEIGILKVVGRAFSFHVKRSRVYRFTEPYLNRTPRKFRLLLSQNLIRKRENAHARLEKRLNKRYPFRKQLLIDQPKLSISPQGYRIAANLMRDPDNRVATKSILDAVEEGVYIVRVNERSQISTSFTSCPRSLRPHLLIDGQPTINCDVGNAHPVFLARVVRDRMDYLLRRDPLADVTRLEEEREKLVALLSTADFYAHWCNNPGDRERDRVKNTFKLILNGKPAMYAATPLYQSFRDEFPQTAAIITSINKKSNKNISKQMQPFTSDAIARSLLEVQRREIAAIPQVDAICCQVRHREVVSEVVGHHVFDVSGGVCCTLAGIRYVPAESLVE